MSNTGVYLIEMAAALCIIWANVALANEPTQPGDELMHASKLAENGSFQCKSGNYTESERLLRECLAIRTRLLPPGDARLAATLNDLGASLHYQSRHKEAELLYKQALEGFGDRAEYLAERVSTLGNLASVHREQRQFDEAASIYSQLFELFSQHSIGELTIATVLNDYGMLLRAKGDWPGAERAFERAAGIRERKHDPGLASILASMGDLNYAQRKFDRAEELFRQSLKTCEHTRGSNDRLCAAPLNGLALTLVRRGLVDEPEQLFRRSLAIFEHSYGPNHPKVAAVLNNLGSLEERKHDYKHAEEHLSRAIELWTAVFGPDHPDVAAASTNLATVYMRRRQFTKAEALYRQALATDEKLLGTKHEKVALDYNNLGVLYSTMKRYPDAEASLARAIAVNESALGEDSPAVAGVLLNLANQHLLTKRYADALPLYKRAFDIYEEHPADQTVVAAEAFDNYAKLLRKTADYAEAQRAEAVAMRIRVKNTIVRDRLQSSFAAGN